METFPALSLCLSVETVAVKQTVRPPLFPPYHRLPLLRQVSLPITLIPLSISLSCSLFMLIAFFRLYHVNLVPSLRPIRGSRTYDHPSCNPALAHAAIQVIGEICSKGFMSCLELHSVSVIQ